ncbi:DUF308 domain-containing protein [Faecalimicrobium dakarense]|uniref:DUF308 domain-containing protein n=1 Tax=Faecalimicrobium dakarense TaxID=1301100 RepID=UPI0004BAB410|nr:DUF308 domain-containing protein [[Clostridium] dakarense]
MFQIFNINFDNMFKKENSTKFVLMGVLLLGLGAFSFFNKHIGIKITSMALSIVLLFFAYLNLKNINELRRYASKEEIRPFTNLQIILLVSAVILFLFPEKIQVLISSIAGAYIIFSQVKRIIINKNNPYYRFGAFNILTLLFGFTLILSPLFLSRFIVSILSILIMLIGSYLISMGNRLK